MLPLDLVLCVTDVFIVAALCTCVYHAVVAKMCSHGYIMGTESRSLQGKPHFMVKTWLNSAENELKLIHWWKTMGKVS